MKGRRRWRQGENNGGIWRKETDKKVKRRRKYKKRSRWRKGETGEELEGRCEEKDGDRRRRRWKEGRREEYKGASAKRERETLYTRMRTRLLLLNKNTREKNKTFDTT